MFKKLKVLLVFVCLLSIALATACSPAAPATPTAQKVIKAAVLLEGPLADTGWNTSCWESMQALSKEYGWDVSYIDNTETEDMEELMRGYGQKGYDIVFGPGWLFSDPMKKVAPEFPNTTWVNINEHTEAGENFSSNGWVTGEVSYFAGLVAAKMTKTNKIAWIAGTESPLVSYDKEVFENQAKAVNPDATTIISYVGNWQDPAKAKELAKASIESGVDVILSVAGSGDFGVFEAINEAKASGKDVKIIGWTGDICKDMPEQTLLSIVQLPGYLLKLAGDEFQKGTLKSGYSVYSIKNGAQDLAWCGTNVPADLQKEVDDLLQQYIDGTLDVPVRTDL